MGAVPELPSGVCSFGFQCSDKTSQFLGLAGRWVNTVWKRNPPTPTCLLQPEITECGFIVLNQLPRPFFSKWMRQPLLFSFDDGLLLSMPSRSLFGISSLSSFGVMVYRASGWDSEDAVNKLTHRMDVTLPPHGMR